eukprot:194578-Chlamydomonas_euryale.AAC.5
MPISTAYLFPAIGHAASLLQWPEITDDVFLLAAEALSTLTSDADAAEGRLFPPLRGILDVSVHVMGRLIAELGNQGMSDAEAAAFAEQAMWRPEPRAALTRSSVRSMEDE